jgi:molecular chaperone HscC
VDIRFTYDLNGVLEVEATIVATGTRVTHVVSRYAKGLSAKEIKKAVERMQSLKHHPREEEENRLIVERGERLYAELPAVLKRDLEQLLSAFEEALELQVHGQIERCRFELAAFLSLHDPFGEAPSESESSDG